ncbi:hypothetical protein [Saccharopolyspora sp. ASAGF58]|uniref:hypothetical protein n=1 Tax=Saccharopolyspora sp. ASAGF58 TaxID=2719023 RepID=UPI001FF082F3|nr:hypothetical protein [Saccharopolyspora sp. ASAGF58]
MRHDDVLQLRQKPLSVLMSVPVTMTMTMTMGVALTVFVVFLRGVVPVAHRPSIGRTGRIFAAHETESRLWGILRESVQHVMFHDTHYKWSTGQSTTEGRREDR